MLLPHTLYDDIGISYVDNSFSIFTWHGRLMYNGTPYRWKTVYGKEGKTHVGEGYSDHLPIMAKFVLQPFSFTDHTQERTVGVASSCDGGVTGFETGVEGWMPYNRSFRLTRDTLNSSDGRYSLKIEGLSKKSIGAAHSRLPLINSDAGPPKAISFDLRGSGRFAFRMQVDDERKICYTGEDFTRQMKSTRYVTHSINKWQHIILPLPQSAKNGEAVDLEIRVAGKEVLCVWIDNVKIF